MTDANPTTVLSDEVVLDIGKLKAYTKVKQSVAREVRSLKRFFAQRGDQARADECQELIVRLAEDRFTLAVVGQFNRGKSSLMNAVIGRDLLPTGVLPLTSAVTILKFGPQERLVVRREGFTFPEEAPVERLADYVTEKGNPANRKKVQEACLELPLALLRRGLEFVDTPGVGSTIEANTATAYGFLPRCDAVLFVTGVDTPLTKTEGDFLIHIREYVRKIFFVVNKTDLLGQDERDEVLRFTSDAMKTLMGGQAIRVFPVSCRTGLEAKTVGDRNAYAASGLKALEEALAEFLSSEKASTFLTSVLDKAVLLITEASLQDPDAAEVRDSLAKRCGTVQRQILHLEDRPASDAEPTGPLPKGGPAPAIPPPAEHVPSAAAEADLERDLRTRGCPVCQHMGRTVSDFFAHWQYALASDEAAQTAFAAEMGFCPLHAWQLFALSSPQGTSLGYPRLLERLSSELSRAASMPTAAGAIPRVPDSGNCRVCGLLREVERTYTGRLAEFVQSAEGRQAYARSQGVCLRHLDLLVKAVASEEASQFLLAEAARHFEETAEDMQSFAIKWDAIRRTLHNRDEGDAYVRAVIRVVGESRVCVPGCQDKEMRRSAEWNPAMKRKPEKHVPCPIVPEAFQKTKGCALRKPCNKERTDA